MTGSPIDSELLIEEFGHLGDGHHVCRVADTIENLTKGGRKKSSVLQAEHLAQLESRPSQLAQRRGEAFGEVKSVRS